MNYIIILHKLLNQNLNDWIEPLHLHNELQGHKMYLKNRTISVKTTFIPEVAELLLNTIFYLFKIEVKCKKITITKKSFSNRFLGQILILPQYLIKIFGECGVDLQSCDTIASINKIIFINKIEKIIYRCSTNKLESVGITNNYNYLISSKFSNIPKLYSFLFLYHCPSCHRRLWPRANSLQSTAVSWNHPKCLFPTHEDLERSGLFH